MKGKSRGVKDGRGNMGMERRREVLETSSETNNGVGKMDCMVMKGIQKRRNGRRRYAKRCKNRRYWRENDAGSTKQYNMNEL
jgi:hypothetical protein